MKMSKVEQPRPYTISEIKIPDQFDNPFYRADLEFYGIDHSDVSFEARIFFNNLKADMDTPLKPEYGYASSLYIFGHGGKCYGGPGHCDVPKKRRNYDFRSSHHLTPMFSNATVTKALKKMVESGEKNLDITVVPIIEEKNDLTDMKNFFKCEKISLVTYD